LSLSSSGWSIFAIVLSKSIPILMTVREHCIGASDVCNFGALPEEERDILGAFFLWVHVLPAASRFKAAG
jgi:hypothetical protein